MNFQGHQSILIFLLLRIGPYEYPLKFTWANGSQALRKFLSTPASVHKPLEQKLFTGRILLWTIKLKSCNALPDRRNCPLEVNNPVILIFQVITGIS